MSRSTRLLSLGLGLAAVLCPSRGSAVEEPPGPARPPVRVYTNADLDRVRPLRGETGVLSVPGTPPPSPEARGEPRSGAGRGGAAGRGEAYWRREAEKLRERTRALADRADELRARIAEQEARQRHSTRGGRRSASAGGDAAAALRGRLAALERRMRELDDDLAERARREGALPGWLR